MKVPQSVQVHVLLRDLRAINARAEQIPRTVSQAELDWQPPDGGWSVSQVFDHLCVVNDSYLKVLYELVPDSRASFGAANTDWKPSLVGRLLARSMESKRKLPTPKIWRPIRSSAA